MRIGQRYIVEEIGEDFVIYVGHTDGRPEFRNVVTGERTVLDTFPYRENRPNNRKPKRSKRKDENTELAVPIS